MSSQKVGVPGGQQDGPRDGANPTNTPRGVVLDSKLEGHSIGPIQQDHSQVFGESPIRRPLTGKHPPARSDASETENLRQASSPTSSVES